MMALLRAEVRRLEKPVRTALREQVLRRLERGDIEIVVDALGGWTPADGIFTLDEMRAFLDPALHDETQSFLRRIRDRKKETEALDSPTPVNEVPSPIVDEDFEWLQRQHYMAKRMGTQRGGK